MGFPGGQMVKNLSAMWETWIGKIPWRKAWQPTLIFLPGEPRGQRTLAATVHRIANSRTRMKQLNRHMY